MRGFERRVNPGRHAAALSPAKFMEKLKGNSWGGVSDLAVNKRLKQSFQLFWGILVWGQKLLFVALGRGKTMHGGTFCCLQSASNDSRIPDQRGITRIVCHSSTILCVTHVICLASNPSKIILPDPHHQCSKPKF